MAQETNVGDDSSSVAQADDQALPLRSQRDRQALEKFTDNPTRAELREVKVLDRRLTSDVSGRLPPANLTTLGRALKSYAESSDLPPVRRLRPLVEWQTREPKNEFSITVGLEIVAVASKTGDFKLALQTLDLLNARLADLDSTAASHASAARVIKTQADFYRGFGMRKRLEQLLEAVKDRPPHPISAQALIEGRLAAETWRTSPMDSLQCGLVAHNIIASMTGQALISRYDPNEQAEDGQAATWGIDLSKERLAELVELGLSGAALLARVEKANPGWRWVRRLSGIAVPAPCVAHLLIEDKTGHYTAVTSAEGDRVKLQDMYLRMNGHVEADAFARQCSGYFLIPPGVLLGEDFIDAGAEELGQFYGRDSCPTLRDPEGDTCDEPSCSGMPVPYFDSFMAFLRLKDEPLSYQPVMGPGLDLSIRYFHRDFTGDSVLDDTSNLGANWSHGLLTYMVAEDNSVLNSSSTQPVKWVRKGTQDTYIKVSTAYQRRYAERPTLTWMTSPAGFRLTFPKGEQLEFNRANLTSGQTRYYLTKIKDVSGLAVTISYIDDTTNRIDYVTDAAGRVTKFVYFSFAFNSTSANPSLIRAIVTNYTGSSTAQPNDIDEFDDIVNNSQHRFARFSYDEENKKLIGITDSLGLESTFTYGNPSDPTQITKLTTPYGDTSFTCVNFPSQYYGHSWSLYSTDPAGLVRRIESVYHDYGTALSYGDKRERRPGSLEADGGAPKVSGVNKITVGSGTYDFLSKESNDFDHNHVTFEWNAKQWREYQKAVADTPFETILRRSFATATVWAMDGTQDITTKVPLIRKVPGMSAEFYNYDGQTSPFHHGSQYGITPKAYAPLKIARRVEGNAPTGPSAASVWTMTADIARNTSGNVTQAVDEMGRVTNYTYDTTTKNFMLTAKAGTANWRVMTYDAGLLDSVRANSYAGWAVNLRNSAKQPTHVDVVNANTALQKYRLTYDADGQGTPDNQPGYLMKVERSSPTVVTNYVTVAEATYDAWGRMVTHKDEAGQVREFTYDKMDRVTKIEYMGNTQNGQTTTEEFVYYLLDLQSSKDRAGLWTHFIHDKVRRPIMNIAPDNRVTKYEWCSCGSLYKLIDPAGRVTEWKRDILGRVTEKIMPDGITKTSYAYWDLSGLLKSITRPREQGGSAPTVTYYYNKDGSLRLEDYPDTADTPDVTYHYTTTIGGSTQDPLGRLLFVEDGIIPPGATLPVPHALTYVASTAGLDGSWMLAYYNGPFTSDRIQYVYDTMDRVKNQRIVADTGATFTDATATRFESYTWDNLGRLATRTDALGTHTATYSTLLSRPDSITGPNSITTALTYKADTDGLAARGLASIAHSRSGTVLASHTYGYDPAGRLGSWEHGGSLQAGFKHHYTHNLNAELTHEQTTVTGTNVLADSATWAYDEVGNWHSRTQMKDGLVQTRSYDSGQMNRLTGIGGTGKTIIEGLINEWAQVEVTPNGGSPQAASLIRDPTGTGYRYRAVVPVTTGTNSVEITATDQDSQTTSKTWDFEVPALGSTLTYDANGNVLSDGVRTFTWDAKNRLRTVTKGSTTWKWDYDWMDRRVKEYENTALTKIYIWSGTQLVQVRDAANVILKTYLNDGWVEGAAGSTTVAAKYNTLKDHLGSVRQVVDSSGAVRARHDYDAYGAQTTPVTTPPLYSNLQAWLRADTGVVKDGSNKVTEWRSHGFAGHFATLTSPTSGARPLWVDTTLNGRPVIRFDGTDDFLEGAAGFSGMTEDFTVFVVHRRSNTATGGAPFTFNHTSASGPGYLTLAWQNNSWTSPSQTLTAGLGLGAQNGSPWAGTPRVETAPDGTNVWQITTAVKSNTSWVGTPFVSGSQIRSNLWLRNQSSNRTREDVKTAFTQTYTGGPNGYGLGRGVLDSGGVPLGYLQGDIAEVLVYIGALSAAEQQQVEEYLGRRHGMIHDKPSDFRFTGHHYHEGSGLHLALYRAYDGNLGRWLSEDPLEDAELNEGPNLYRYGANRPIDTIDPDGRWVWLILGAAFGGATTAWAPGPEDDTSQPPASSCTPFDFMGGGGIARMGVQRTAISAMWRTGALNAAASSLGINLSNIVIKNGTAFARVGIAQTMQPRHILGLVKHLKKAGAKKICVGSGKLANPKLDIFLSKFADEGLDFYGGKVMRSTNGLDDYILQF